MRTEQKGSRRFHVDRRGVISHGIVGGAGVVLGAGGEIAREWYEQKRLEVTGEPFDVQIRRVEQRVGQEGLRDRKLLEHYSWLVALWYGEKFSLGAFYDGNNPFAAAEVIHAAIYLIESESDPRLKGNENLSAWTNPGESITMNLTTRQMQEKYPTNPTGATITSLMVYRDNLTHEMTHFITEPRDQAIAIGIIKTQNPQFGNMKKATLSGFRIYFDPDQDNPGLPVEEYLDDFDEAATEFIANYEQRISGLAVGLPSYPEAAIDEQDQSKVEKIIETLDGTIKLVGIRPEQFMILHRLSDLDGLAKFLAEATTRRFLTDEAKITYGLRIIDAIRRVDRAVLGDFVRQIR